MSARFRSFKQANRRRVELTRIRTVRPLFADEQAELEAAVAFVDVWLEARYPLPTAYLERVLVEARQAVAAGEEQV